MDNIKNNLSNDKQKKNLKKSEKIIISNLAKLDSKIIVKNIKNNLKINNKYIECYSNDQ
jgi:hypothetical protein